MSCDEGLNEGCQGGYIYYAFKFIEKHGLVSNTVYPYVSGKDGKTHVCDMKGKDSKEKHFAKKDSTKDMSADIEGIKNEIYTRGPLATGFVVYSDFPTYKSGIYVRTSVDALGLHAVKLVGWGHEDGIDYWKVANSWGLTWGEEGYFRFAMKQCGIEHSVVKVESDGK